MPVFAKKALKAVIMSFLFLAQANAQPYCNNGCRCIHRFWADAEYLGWKIKDSPEPVPLVATAPVIHNGDPLIGEPGTKVVLGGKEIHNQWRSGGRFSVGCWFDKQGCYAGEALYFFLPRGTTKHKVFSSGLPGSPFLAVPYFDTVTGMESSSPVAEPGLFEGLAKLKVSNEMQGAEINGMALLFSGCSFKLNGIFGVRYWNFNERLKFSVNSPNITIPAEIFRVSDRFRVDNNFYGGQVGLGFDYCYGRFFLDVKGKLALGAMEERVKIKGRFLTNSFNGFGPPQSFPGGYFALPSNIGRHRDTVFAILPEVSVNVGCKIIDCLQLKIGYTFLYVNKVLWAGKQINRNINPTQSVLYEFTPTPTVDGKPLPKGHLKNESIWAQGVNVGLEYLF